MTICQLDAVHKHYAMGELQVHALRGVDVAVEAGEFTAFAGPSGSGKTTLLNLVGLLDTPTSGSVLLEGRDISSLSAAEIGAIRARRIGFVFQSFNLIPVLTAFENVELALRLGSDMGPQDRKDRVAESLQAVGLGELMGRRPSQLSGGQQQRVAIARALVKSPALVIADEPTANLDSKTGRGVLDIMGSLNDDHGVTFLFSTHDPMVIDQARRVVHIKDGCIEDDEQSEPVS
jgi:putative ABC transport system ATP-binding protein